MTNRRDVPDVAEFVPLEGFGAAFSVDARRIDLAPRAEQVVHFGFAPPDAGAWAARFELKPSALCPSLWRDITGRGVP